MSQKEMLTTQEAADYLGLSKATLDAWRCRGGGPVFQKFGKAVRYWKPNLDDFRESHKRTSTSA